MVTLTRSTFNKLIVHSLIWCQSPVKFLFGYISIWDVCYRKMTHLALEIGPFFSSPTNKLHIRNTLRILNNSWSPLSSAATVQSLLLYVFIWRTIHSSDPMCCSAICVRDNIARHTICLLIYWPPGAILSLRVWYSERKAPGLWSQTNAAAVLMVNKLMTS